MIKAGLNRSGILHSDICRERLERLILVDPNQRARVERLTEKALVAQELQVPTPTADELLEAELQKMLPFVVLNALFYFANVDVCIRQNFKEHAHHRFGFQKI